MAVSAIRNVILWYGRSHPEKNVLNVVPCCWKKEISWCVWKSSAVMWRTKIRKEKKRYFRIVKKIIKYTTEFANYSLKSDFICVRITLYSYDIRVERSLHT